MNKAFVDTTILTDILLKVSNKRTQASEALKKYDSTELPLYAIKEFKAGPLRNMVWMYNKFHQTKSFEKALRCLQTISQSPKKYLTATAIESMVLGAHNIKNLSTQDLVDKYGPNAKLDFVLKDRFKYTIKTKVLVAWNKRRKVTSSVCQELFCFKERNPYEIDGQLFLDPMKCDEDEGCCLSLQLKDRLEDLVKIRETLESMPVKPETQRRLRVIRGIIRKPKSLLTDKQCRDLGDIYFVLFSPKDSVILTTNTSDFVPLASSLSKRVESPNPLD